jgi:hypothetical protein
MPADRVGWVTCAGLGGLAERALLGEQLEVLELADASGAWI